jgi:signal transduction histidine kinase
MDDIQKGPLNPTQKEALDNLKERLKSLHHMSEEMVNAFKNLEIFLKGGFMPQKIDYIQKVNEKIKPYSKMAQEKGLAFEALLPKRIFIYVDPLSIERILDELLSNAVKFTDQGKIMVKVSCENPEEVLTEISDTGCGIPEENREGIWELFKRIETHQKTEGAGIGLAMARQLVEANGGKIWVKSSVGQGSRFFFTLPTVGEGDEFK